MGYSHDLLHNRSSPHSTPQVQRFYTSWDSNGLAFTWEGTNWDGEGDLFIYLDTEDGGGQFAVSPYRLQHYVYLPLVNLHTSAQASAQGPDSGSQYPSPASQTSDTWSRSTSAVSETTTPRDGRSAISLPFDGDYVIYLEDTSTAVLLRWDGQAWTGDRTLPAGQVWYDTETHRISLYLPFNEIGIDDPASTSLGLIALASEEQALHLWSAMPSRNPLNSPRVRNPFFRQQADRAGHRKFALLRVYQWENLADGVCPTDASYSQADVRLAIASTPRTAIYSYLEDGLFHRKKRQGNHPLQRVWGIAAPILSTEICPIPHLVV